jgi:hypothetical protein
MDDLEYMLSTCVWFNFWFVLACLDIHKVERRVLGFWRRRPWRFMFANGVFTWSLVYEMHSSLDWCRRSLGQVASLHILRESIPIYITTSYRIADP